MNLNPLISIIIPVYDCDKYIKHCLDSIINQSIGFDKLEVILINDQSPGEENIIIEKNYLSKYPNISLIKNKINLGPGGSRNVGIKLAKSNLITFIDGDDWYHEDFCLTVYEDYLKHNSDITVCGMRNTVDGVNIKWKTIPKKGIYKFEDKTDLLFTVTVECHSPYRLYNKNLFINNNIFFLENAYYEDTAIMPQLFYYANQISCIDKILYNYRANPVSIVNTSSLKHINDIIDSWDQILQKIPINTKGIHFFWWMLAHNVFRKRNSYLNQISTKELTFFVSKLIFLINKYPILIYGFEKNNDVDDIVSSLKKLNELHNNIFSNEIDFLKNFKKEKVKGLISVIMPAFNTSLYIEEAILSILNQTYANLELIIINDNSTDNTSEIAKSLKDPRIKIIDIKKSSGAYYARNIGLYLSQGEYFTFVDSDDIISPDRFERFLQYFTKNNELKLVEARFIRYDYDLKKPIFKLFSQGVGGGFYKKSVVDDLGYFLPVKGGGDSEYSERTLKKYGADNVYLVNDFTYWNVERTDGLTTTNPQGSISRENFKQFYLTENINKISFPWKKNCPIVNKTINLEIGQKSYNEKIQDINISILKETKIYNHYSTINTLHKLSNYSLGHYYSEFLKNKEYINKLELKLKNASRNENHNNNMIIVNEIKSHYNNVYENMPIWWKKLGALIRKIKTKV